MKQPFNSFLVFLSLTLLTGCSLKNMGISHSAWILKSIDGGNIPLSHVPKMELTKEGRVSGFAGCNRFSGEYKHSGGELSFAHLISTRKACRGERMKLENQFLQELGATVSYSEKDGELLLTTGKATTLVFEKAAAE